MRLNKNSRYFSKTLSRQFRFEWLFLVSTLLILASFMAYALFSEYRTTGQREQERLATQTQVIHDNLIRQLEAINRAQLNIRNELAYWNWNPQAGGMAQASRRLKAFVNAMPSIRTLLILDAEGNVRASNRDELIGKSFHERDYFQTPLKFPNPNTFYIGSPFKTLLNVFAMNVTRIVPGPDNEFDGVISATLDPEEFKILLGSVRYAPDMWTALQHGDGSFFLAMPERREVSGVDLAQPATVMAEAGFDADNPRMMAQRTVQPATLNMDKPLVVIVSRDLNAVYAPVWHEARIRYGLFTTLAILMAISLYLVQRRRHMVSSQAEIAKIALREKSEELERFFSVSLDLMCIADTAGYFRKLNPAWETTLGYPLAELEGAYFLDFVHPDDVAATLAVMADLDAGNTLVSFTNRYRCQDGSYRVVEWRSASVDQLIYAAAHDVTEQHRNQEALAARTTEAESANRYKSQFLANMSHEIRTPMNAVLGLLQLLQHTKLTARQLDYAQKAQSAAESLLAILNDILDFSKVESGKMEIDQSPFRLDQLLRNLSVLLAAAVKDKDVEVLFDIRRGIPQTLRGDALRLQQILLNLASNAIKFTEQGEVVVALHTVTATQEQVRIEFSVQDTGIGIPADKLATIFEGFTQAEASTSRRYGGTGLGLAISQRLVRLMGGNLIVESEPGRGSSFAFTLDFPTPKARDVEPRSQRVADQTHPESGALHVMIVDDNAMARVLLEHMAHQFGWRVDVAASGAEALARLAAKTPPDFRYDVVFVDWKMPGMDGWETAQRIRQIHNNPLAPIIVMVTAHGREVLAEKLTSTANPLDGFLVKPVTPSMLFDTVVNASAGRSVTIDRRAVARPTGFRLAGLRLLVVEDNLLNQQVAQELLAHEGAYVEVASDGSQGVERVMAAESLLDAVLMDVQMLGMDGFEATRILRQELGIATLPIIAMTANALPSDRETCLAAGMNDHVGKPIDVEILVATLLRHCHKCMISMEISKPVAPKALPEVPEGFVLAKALARLSGNQSLYASLAHGVRADQGHAVDEVRRLLQQDARADAMRVLHTIKGVAATLGAEALSHLAAEIEDQIEDGIAVDAVEIRLVSLAQALEEALTVVERVADEWSPPVRR